VLAAPVRSSGEAEPRLDLRFDHSRNPAGTPRRLPSPCRWPPLPVPGTNAPDVDRVERLAGDRIERHARAVDERRQVQPRRLFRIVFRRIEVRDLAVGRL